MKTTVKISAIQCDRCANSIHKSLGDITGVFGVNVNMISGDVTIDHTDEVSEGQLIEKLLQTGYHVITTPTSK